MKKTSELNVREIEKKINYTFKDKSLLIQAFTRTSFCNEVNPTAKVKYHSNEVLEFFGDGVLSLSIISFLLKECTERYEHGIKTELNEGDFSNIKSKLSDKQNLSKSMKALGLEKHLLMGEGDAKLGIQNEPSVMEDLFESIVGAIFIDSDMSIRAVIDAVAGMLDMSVYTSKQKIAQSAKNALQEWCADKKHRLPPPRYETLSEDGPDHKKTYMRACYIGDKLMGRGIGKNFKLADAAAAEDALKTLMAQNEQISQTKIVKSQDKPKAQDKKELQAAPVSSVKSAGAEIAERASAPTAVAAKKAVSRATLLKNYAVSNKKSSPIFKDLGERKNGQKTEYAVECSFANELAVGTGATRTEAREAACKLIADKIGIGRKQSQKSNRPSESAKEKQADVKQRNNHSRHGASAPGKKAPQKTVQRKNPNKAPAKVK